MDSYDRQRQNISAEAVRRIALYALTELKNFELPVQSLILEKRLLILCCRAFSPTTLRTWKL